MSSKFYRDITTPRREWALFGIFLTVLMSRIAWYDLRTIYAESGTDFELSIYFTAWSVLLIPIFSFYLLREILFRRLDTFAIIFIFLIIYSTVMGLILGNDINYVAQDAVKYMFLPSAYIATKRVLVHYPPEKVVHLVLKICVSYICLRYIIFAYLRGSLYGMRYGGVQELFPICALAGYSFSVRTTKSLIIGLILLLLLMFLDSIGQKRTTLMCMSIIFVMWLPSLFVTGRLGRSLGLSVLIILLGFGSFLLLSFAGGILFDRISTIMEYDNQVGYEQLQRAVEVQTIYGRLVDHPLAIVFGYGGGETFHLPSFFNAATEGEIHSVHFTLAAMWLRHGLIGLAIYIYTFFSGIGRSLGLLLGSRSQAAVVRNAFLVISYKVIAFVASLTMFGGVDDALIGVLTCIAVYNARDQARSLLITTRHVPIAPRRS